MLGYLLYKFGEPKIGYNGVFWIVFGFCSVAFVLGVFFKEEHEWKKGKSWYTILYICNKLEILII